MYTLDKTEKATKKVSELSTKIINAEYSTKHDLPSSYSRDERKIYQNIIEIIDEFFSSDPETAKKLHEFIKNKLGVNKK